MAKRPLGLGKKNKEKKRKVQVEGESDSRETTPGATNQLNIELDDNVDLDNELSQLQGLWLNYFRSDRDNEYVLNGIVHECDRLLRQAQEDEQMAKQLNDKFHAIYALALSELTIFKAGEEEDRTKNQVSEFFVNALERCESGQTAHPDSDLLKLVLSKIILQRIPLEYISGMTVDSKDKLDLNEQLETAKKNFVAHMDDLELTFEVLQMMNDLLDIIENFGHENDIEEGLDSDDEEELENIELTADHPLHFLKNDVSSNYDWLRSALTDLLNKVDEKNTSVYHPIAKTIGELYLKEAEEPTAIFMELQYGEDEKLSDSKECKASQKKALKSTSTALEFLKKAQINDDPKTWVQVAEAYIDFGNLQDYQSKEQEESYKSAEEILKKANKATHGKFQVILDNLLENE